ncbi:hypothetical protein [Microcystis sp. M061S2]|uniref:hypothetical protein n=1 Tax=Microcystis sp. M061S2 TaxID=2771171 RepID=UPI00258B7DBD|nr:hypothetical protein [Microcystis sp. M061S2]MCA2652791.1 hypothetical protein [Microcystis sp. M061S2]
MKTLEFLSELNAAPQGWGFWIDRQQIEANHVGQFSYQLSVISYQLSNKYLSKINYTFR